MYELVVNVSALNTQQQRICFDLDLYFLNWLELLGQVTRQQPQEALSAKYHIELAFRAPDKNPNESWLGNHLTLMYILSTILPWELQASSRFEALSLVPGLLQVAKHKVDTLWAEIRAMMSQSLEDEVDLSGLAKKAHVICTELAELPSSQQGWLRLLSSMLLINPELLKLGPTDYGSYQELFTKLTQLLLPGVKVALIPKITQNQLRLEQLGFSLDLLEDTPLVCAIGCYLMDEPKKIGDMHLDRLSIERFPRNDAGALINSYNRQVLRIGDVQDDPETQAHITLFLAKVEFLYQLDPRNCKTMYTQRIEDLLNPQ